MVNLSVESANASQSITINIDSSALTKLLSGIESTTVFQAKFTEGNRGQIQLKSRENHCQFHLN